MIQSALATLADLGYVQIFAFAFALIYILLAAKNSILCWVFGIASSSLWAFEAWHVYELFYDSLLNIFYVVMGGVGWWNWIHKENSSSSGGIISLSMAKHLGIILGGGFLSLISGFVAWKFSSASLPFIDAPTTIFSIIATFLLIKKDLSNWLYWIVVDGVYVGIYFYKGAYLFGLLFIIYTIMALYGWREWRKMHSKNDFV